MDQNQQSTYSADQGSQLTYPLDYVTRQALIDWWLDYTQSFYEYGERMTYASTITLNPALGMTHIVDTSASVGNATINASSTGWAGQKMFLIINNDSGAGRTITFSTNFRPNGTLTGTASKTATVQFISDGTAWFEVCRTLAL